MSESFINFIKRNYSSKKRLKSVINGQNINNQDEEGNSAIHFAVKYRKIKLVRLLLKRGANPNVANNNSETAFHLGIMNSDTKIVKLLLKSKKIDLTLGGEYEMTPLHYAVLFNATIEIMNLLFKYKCDINTVDEDGHTPLHYAVEELNYVLAEILLKANAKIDIKSKNGYTVIDLLNTKGKERMLETFECQGLIKR